MPRRLFIPPPDGINVATPRDIGLLVSQCKLDESLRIIGVLSHYAQDQDPPYFEMEGIPVTNGILAYIALKLVEFSDNNLSKTEINETVLKKAIQLWSVIPEPIVTKEDIDELNIRQNLSQYYYNEDPLYHLARYYALFNDYWQKNPFTKNIDIKILYESTTGFNLKEAMIFGFVLTENSKGGLVKYSKPDKEFHDRLLKQGVDLLRQPKFLQWFSHTYQSFQNEIASQTIVDDLEKYRENPLLKKPLLIPEISYRGSYILPIPILLAYAVSLGTFHILGNNKINTNSGDFRGHFGRIFEDYVFDQISRIQTLTTSPMREKKYGKKGKEKPTSDISVVNGRTAVLIEAKHSCLNIPSKLNGSLEDIREAIRDNIVDGIIQLSRFRYNLRNVSTILSLSDFKEITEFEHLIVTHDNISGLNSIIREQAMQVLKECNIENAGADDKIVPDNFHVHIMNISELERIVEVPTIDLFSFLKSKKERIQSDKMDFDEFGESQFGNLPHNRLLEGYFNAFKNEFKEET